MPIIDPHDGVQEGDWWPVLSTLFLSLAMRGHISILKSTSGANRFTLAKWQAC